MEPLAWNSVKLPALIRVDKALLCSIRKPFILFDWETLLGLSNDKKWIREYVELFTNLSFVYHN